MRVAVGCDHAGFALKQTVCDAILREGHEVVDCGTNSTDPVDYPDVAAKVSAAVIGGKAARGILVCGSGVGASVAANKIRGIRASVCHDTYSAGQGVEHDDMNVLCLGGRIIGPAVVPSLIHAFLGAQFSGEQRHQRRLDKVLRLEATGVPGQEETS